MLRSVTMNMNQLKPMIIALLMLTSALAGCAGTDTTDLEQQIVDLQQSNDEMNETINQQNQDNLELRTLLEGLQLSLDDLDMELQQSNDEMNETINQQRQDLMDEINWVNNTVNWAYMNLSNDNLYDANLRGANLSNADLRDADLRYADLSGADLSNANLYDAGLFNAELRYADLSGADLRDAGLGYANLSNADLTGADLTGAWNLWLVFWNDTTCPDGTNSNNNGNTCENNL